MRTLIFSLFLLPLTAFGQTLEACQQAAERNYPLIREYGLIEKTTELTLSNIRKGWLPQLSASAQGTVQSDVTAFPPQMQALYEQMGLEMEGLGKGQYRLGIDVQQNIYDGGNMESRKEVARRQGELEATQNEVKVYQVRRSVNEMYFSLLLVEAQIRLNDDLQQLLEANEQKLASMLQRGTAAESDWQSVKAERLNARQQLTSLLAQRSALRRMLSTFCGIEVKDVEKPPLVQPETDARNMRPELKAIDAQLRLADAQEKALATAWRPKIGLFAQGYYGYPGYNMFEDMLKRTPSWNAMVGARITWNIGALYTRRNDNAKIRLQRESAEVGRERFMLENQMQQIGQDENIMRYSRLMADDEEIITLRQNVRKAAESKLEHGIIDVNDLLKEINGENAARIGQAIHEIEMLKEIYDLKFTKNI
ncbi:MAG: TolC family protein [Bacteroidales bacterium]|nr:TolC family protein [Bacteroidales bacterium]